MAVWCERCNRSFRSYSAYYQHVRDSSRHWSCPNQCEDHGSWNELLHHCEDSGCGIVCWGCKGGSGEYFMDDRDYWEHVDDFNVCTTCDRHFASPDNLNQHELSHRSLDYECLRCDRGFKTYGGMMIHLESGCCSDVDRDHLDALAAQCRRCDEFIFEDYQQNLIDGDLEYYHGNVSPYFCPTCDATMPKLSSLFQHVESQSCGQTLDSGAIGTLRRYLENYL